MNTSVLKTSGQRLALLPLLTITAAISPAVTTAVSVIAGARSLIVQAAFAYGSGGTSADVYVQTSFDGGTTWVDVMQFNFLLASATKVSKVDLGVAVAAAYTPTDGTLASNSIKDGLLGDRIRLKYKSSGTYAGGTTLQVDAVIKA